MKDLAFLGYCVSVIGQCACVIISHIDAYTWASSRMADDKVTLWIVKVNVINSPCCFDYIFH